MILKLKIWKNNQAGVSLVMVLIALSLLGAGTTYIMKLSELNTVNSAISKTTILLEIEKRRVSAILSNSQICTANIPYFTTGPITTDIAFLTTGVLAENIIQKNGLYYDKTLNLIKISTGISASTPFPGTAKQYELVLQYQSLHGNLSFSGRMNTAIRIPMYMKVVAGVITNCYTMAENSDIDSAITANCSPTTPASNTRAVLKRVNGVASECDNSISFVGANVSTCANMGTLFTGFKLAAVAAPNSGNVLTFPIVAPYSSGLTGAGNSCTTGQSLYQLNSSNITCSSVGSSTRDSDGVSALCMAGQLLWHNAGLSTTCGAAVNCPGVQQFVQTITTAGATCYSAPPVACGATQYASQFNPLICKDLPVISGVCAAGKFGTSITRATGTAGGVLNCLSYNKTKACPTPTNTSFVYQLTAGGANCTQW